MTDPVDDPIHIRAVQHVVGEELAKLATAAREGRGLPELTAQVLGIVALLGTHAGLAKTVLLTSLDQQYDNFQRIRADRLALGMSPASAVEAARKAIATASKGKPS